MTVVGIDLGTTNTVISAFRDGKVTALKDPMGRPLLPSIVSFSPRGTAKVGHEAKARRSLDPENTIFSIKRLIGRTFDSECVRKSLARLPFELKAGPGNSTLVSSYGRSYTLPEISAKVLELAQTVAEGRLGTLVSDAVITVPANFNDLQRAATKVAGTTAGLDVLRIINEPTAAALAYGFGKTGKERIAVYDFGGGTFDVTLLDLRDNVFEVLATAGDTFLGGDDIDYAIMDRMAEQLLKEKKIDASADNVVREQLRAAAEEVKIDLSTRSMTRRRIDPLDMEFTMRRSEFEKLTEPFLARTFEVCREAMDTAGVANSDLDQVLLVGGSTRIPLVRRRLSSFFGKMPQSRINPEEVVAIGAAIQASSLQTEAVRPRIIAAPRINSASPTIRGTVSRPPSALGKKITRTGLAGLTKTLTGVSDATGSTGVASVLSGLKSSIAPTPLKERSPHTAKTLSGVGEEVSPSSGPPVRPTAGRKRLKTFPGFGSQPPDAGLSDASLDEDTKIAESQTAARPPQEEGRARGTTNLGIGIDPDSPPPTFDDLTAVAPHPDSRAASLDQVVAGPSQAKVEDLDEIVETSPFEAMDEVIDGSVTFDLASLDLEGEASDEFGDFDDEPTQVYESKRLIQSTDSAETAENEEVVDLPAPSTTSVIEEISDSALFALESTPEEEGSAPSSSGVESARELSDSVLSALEDEPELPSVSGPLSLKTTAPGIPAPATYPPTNTTKTPASHLDLPMVTGILSTTSAQRLELTADLPTAAADLPTAAADLPTAAADLPATSAGLPTMSAGLPTMSAGLPTMSAGLPTHSSALELNANTIGDPNEEIDLPVPSRRKPGSSTPAPLAKARTGLGPLVVAAPSKELNAQKNASPIDLGRVPLGLDTIKLGSDRPLSAAISEQTPATGSSTKVSFLGSEVSSAPTKASPASEPDTSITSPGGAPPLLLDVTPLSLGVEVSGGYVDRLILRNSPVPCESTHTFATAQDDQPTVIVRVSQGEEDRFNKNTLLGEVQLTGLPRGPRGSVKVDVSFSLDESGMLQVTARDLSSGNATDARLLLTGVAR